MLINIEIEWTLTGSSHNCYNMAVLTVLSMFVLVYVYSRNNRAKMLFTKFRQKKGICESYVSLFNLE